MLVTNGAMKGKNDKGLRKLAITNLAYLTDIKILLGLAGLLPLLCTMHHLMKFSQGRDLFVCDYIAAITCCIAEVQAYYIESDAFIQDIF